MRGDGHDPVRDFFQDANLPPISKSVLIIGILVLVGLSMLMTMFYTVEPDEIAVVQRFSRYNGHATNGHRRSALCAEW